MERKFLEELNLEKDAIDAIMAENGKDIEKAKKPGETAADRVKELEGQLSGVSEKLKAFDGVDVDDLRGQISTLKNELESKEAEYEKKVADHEFNGLLSAEISAAKGISAKAITALLDINTLRESKNQKEDIGAALKALQESDPNQFNLDEKPPFATGGTGATPPGGDMQSAINAQLGIKA